mgnify:CR=1 FL=1
MICGGIIKNDAVIYLYRLACTIFETYIIDDNFKTKQHSTQLFFSNQLITTSLGDVRKSHCTGGLLCITTANEKCSCTDIKAVEIYSLTCCLFRLMHMPSGLQF